MKQYILPIAIIAAAFLAIGCTVPVHIPVSTATATPSPTVSSSPTLIGGNDEAHIIFNWEVWTYTTEYNRIKVTPGNSFYVMHVNVTSDKPVQSSAEWFTMEYKEKDSDPVSVADYTTFSYPGGMIGVNGSYMVGDIEFELPAHLAAGYPKPVYWMDVDKQSGTYKVKQPVYGEGGVYGE
jgi:hypothetical protein